MKISTQTRYSLRLLTELALNENTGLRMTAQQIATNQGLSEKYLESIATKLQKNGIISSSKGFGGGYRLAMPVDQITLGGIMRLMETNFFVTHCIKDPEKNCKVYHKCVVNQFLDKVEAALSETVDAITMADIVERYIEHNGLGQDILGEEILNCVADLEAVL